MAVYNNMQMNSMRREAIRRSNEMHGRSMVNTSHYSQGHHKTSEKESPAEIKQTEDKAAASLKSQPRPISASLKNNNLIAELLSSFSDRKIDSDKLLIMALIIILIKEGADMKLILALGYILL